VPEPGITHILPSFCTRTSELRFNAQLAGEASEVTLL
jgi:hypothetical protein